MRRRLICQPYQFLLRRLSGNRAKAPAVVRPCQMQITWPERHDARRIDVSDRVVATFDACNVCDIGYARPLVELAKVVREVVILVYVIAIAFEITVVGRVEPHQCHVEAPIGFRDPFAAQIALPSQQLLQIVQRVEELPKRFFVSLLRLREATAINAVIDRRVDAIIGLIDLRPQQSWVKIDGSIAPLIEFRIEHADDLGRFRVCWRTDRQPSGWRGSRVLSPPDIVRHTPGWPRACSRNTATRAGPRRYSISH